jgi:N-carbamoyl-L-amino-acid hydrolase
MNAFENLAPATDLRVDGDRLWGNLMEIGRIGASSDVELTRLALTDSDGAARDCVVAWATEAGCEVSVDAIGNIFMRRAGRRDDLSPVLTGSHLDSQPDGGRFDGACGVLAGLEILRTLNARDMQTERALEVVIWTNEEGARFHPATLGSGVFAGAHTLDYGLSRTDADGVRLADALQRIGYAGPAPCGGRNIYAYLEMHIEQGPVLESASASIGAVTAARGRRGYEITLIGEASRAGSTPMERRRDALFGAARLISLVHDIGMMHAPLACATVGMLQVRPNVHNVVPGRAMLTVDFRHPDDAVLLDMDARLRAGVVRVAKDGGLDSEFRQTVSQTAVRFDAGCVAAVRRAANHLGYPCMDIVSGAAHDACQLARVTAAGMVFIPCLSATGRDDADETTPELIEAGANVLMHALLAHALEGDRYAAAVARA